MLWRRAEGQIPIKHHLASRDARGQLIYEHCLTREGFQGGYTIVYHAGRPQAARLVQAGPLQPALPPGSSAETGAASTEPLSFGLRRHFQTPQLPTSDEQASEASVALLRNEDLCLGSAKPRLSDARYQLRVDADLLLYVHAGQGTLVSVFGPLAFGPGDYLCVPKGVLHRFELTGTDHHWLTLECQAGLGLLPEWRNALGQLKMDAPYSERDFRVPCFAGPVDEGLREVCVRRNDGLWRYAYADSPLDVVGYDGSVYPWAFPITAFQPRVGQVHLPPTSHGTFSCQGALICSFLPRPAEFHPEAIPCPYPHSSVDMDEVLFYVRGNFSSRRGVAAGSLSWHGRGVPHGPHPGRYEASLGSKWVDECAVMVDTLRPLHATGAATSIEDADYEASFL